GRHLQCRRAAADRVAPRPFRRLPYALGDRDPQRGAGMTDTAPMLEARDLRVHFPIRKGFLKRVVGHVKAVDGVSLTIKAGETLGLVGESGCGKTTLGQTLVRVLEPTTGEIVYRNKDGEVDLARLGETALRPYRAEIRMIFQDPFASL